MTDDAQLLRRFVRDASQPAFRELVDLHVDLVFSTARRRLGGYRAQAEDVAQSVFSDLARKAPQLDNGRPLAGWLYQHTCFVASSVVRRERRRQHREQEAAAMNPGGSNDDRLWRELSPLLDDVMARLDPADRDALVLRFFERRDLRSVGDSLGLTPDATQKRVARALDRLRTLFAQRGITSTASALSIALTAQAVMAAPAGLAAAVAGPALAAATPSLTLFQTIMTMSKLKTASLTACVLAGVALPLAWQYQTIARQRRTIADLESRLGAGAEATTAARVAHPPPPLRRAGAARPTVDAAAMAAEPGAEGLARVLAERDQVKRLGALSALLQAMTPDQAPLFGKLFTDRLAAGSDFSTEYALFLRSWGAIAGPSAVEFALGSDKANTNDASAALAGWSARDPAAAVAWIDANPQGDQTEWLAAGLAEGWMQQDVDAAAKFIEERPRSHARTGMIEKLFHELIDQRGPEGAKAWFAGITDNENNTAFRERAFDHIAKHLARTDPAAGLNWLLEHAGKPYAIDGSVAAVVAAHAASDPAGAADWAFTHPEVGAGQPHNAALAAAIGAWVEKDASAAAEWLGRKMNTASYDPAAHTFVGRIASLDPESAFAWSQTIGDDSLRRESQAAAARPWFRADSEAATSALAGAGWTAEEIQALQQGPHATFAFADELVFSSQLAESGSGTVEHLGVHFDSVRTTVASESGAGTGAVSFSLDVQGEPRQIIREFQPVRRPQRLPP